MRRMFWSSAKKRLRHSRGAPVGFRNCSRWRSVVRILKAALSSMFAVALLAPVAMAGGAACSGHTSAACTAHATASCTGSMANCRVEATRLASGDLVVHYIGANEEAVKYLHAKAEGSADKFCCGMTQKMASNEKCKVDMARVSNGVIVFVTSANKDVVDQYEKEFAAMTTTK